MTAPATNAAHRLLSLSHALGAEHRQLAILGEGNTSCQLLRLGDDTGDATHAPTGATFLVKASGSSLGTLTERDLVECRSAPLLEMLDHHAISDQQIEDALFAARVDPEARKPSVEALFHAYLLSLPGVRFVGHAHPVNINGILCSPRARDFAENRLFPDEIVCCGPASAFVPYTDPGLRLSQAIRQETIRYTQQWGTPPRVILLENHGVITLGASPDSVLAAMMMAEKSAAIFLAAAALGGPRFLSQEDVARIGSRIDEHYRQKALNL